MNFQNLVVWFFLFNFPLATDIFDSNPINIVSEFNKLSANPVIISYTNVHPVNNTDGHLQGIQFYENNHGKYFFMSGSSESYSYYSVVKSGKVNEIVLVNKLMEKPFKHAGGIQIYKNYLVAGIEDNTLKDKSKVCVYEISDPEVQNTKPVAIIERNGETFRNTAGCAGITLYKNRFLIAVGDWETKHIDFYRSGSKKIEFNGFEMVGSIDAEKISKSGWVNTHWHSYQNINLLSIENYLYLVGLGQNSQSENIADLFEVTEEINGKFSLKKIASKKFNCTNGCSFKAGAGVVFRNGIFEILACDYNIREISYINVFTSN